MLDFGAFASELGFRRLMDDRCRVQLRALLRAAARNRERPRRIPEQSTKILLQLVGRWA